VKGKSALAHTCERGQAMVETALIALLAVIMALGLISLVPAHRTRTAATAAAYACAQFLSQSPNPAKAAQNAYTVAEKTLNGDWSATLGAEYQVQVTAPTHPGQAGSCVVRYRPPVWFGFGNGEWSSAWFTSRSETWKAKWR
jgi:Flp pilus assembly protein TadG